MKKLIAVLAATPLFSVPASAAVACLDTVDTIHIAADTGGVLTLYVYATSLGGSTYLTYSGSNDVVKAFHTQFLFAKAAEKKVCFSYTAGTPSYRWELSAVGITPPNGWPFL